MKNHTGFLIAFGLVAFGLLMRLVPHVANFSPLLAIALFSGVLFPRRYSYLIPLAIVVVSDVIIGFHALSLLIWSSYVFVALIASYMPKKVSVKQGLGAALAASTVFFLVTNFAVWAEGRMYEMTLSGLWQSYVNALPFFRSSLLSDVLYSAAFFGIYAYARKYKGLKIINTLTA